MSKDTLEPPSYEDVVGDGIYIAHTSIAPLQAYSQTSPHPFDLQLDTSRTLHIEEIISTYLLPVIRRRMSMDQSRTTIALLPARMLNVVEDASMELPKIINIVSSHTDGGDDDELQQIHLPDKLGHDIFCSQNSVLKELKVRLENRLVSTWPNITSPRLNEKPVSSEKMGSFGQPTVADIALPIETPTNTKAKSRGMFSWKSSPSRPPNAQPEADGRPDSTRSTVTPSKVFGTNSISNRIDIDIVPDEVCFRTQSSLGIYDTEKRSAVIVKVRFMDRFDAEIT